jgi:DNA-directed RNA polymerase subunit RPC12/RpoP
VSDADDYRRMEAYGDPSEQDYENPPNRKHGAYKTKDGLVCTNCNRNLKELMENRFYFCRECNALVIIPGHGRVVSRRKVYESKDAWDKYCKELQEGGA